MDEQRYTIPLTYVPHSQIFETYYVKDGTIYYAERDEQRYTWAKGFNEQWGNRPVPIKTYRGYPHVHMKHPKYRGERILVRASHLAWTLIHGSKPPKGARIRMINGNKTDFRAENMEIHDPAL